MKRAVGSTSLVFLAAVSLCNAADGRGIRRSIGSPILRHTTAATNSQPKLPAGLTLVDWKQIKAEYERHRHGMFPDGKGGYQSRTHYHGWLAKFDGRGFEVKPDTEPWTWGLELVSWGREGSQIPVSGKATIHTDVNRLEYRREGITEWFVNGKEGLEHGFTIPRRPEGSTSRVTLSFRILGSLAGYGDGISHSASFKSRLDRTVLKYRKLIVNDAKGRMLAAAITIGAQALYINVDDNTAIYPLTIDPIIQKAYLKASNTEGNDHFGQSIAIDKDILVVGAPGEDSQWSGVNVDQTDNQSPDSGAVYIFRRNLGNWTQEAYIKPSCNTPGMTFGFSVAVKDDTVVVGSPKRTYDLPCGFSSVPSTGAIYVFRKVGSWAQNAVLKAPSQTAYDSFGFSVAISSGWIAVGMPNDDSEAVGVYNYMSDPTLYSWAYTRNSGADTGAVFVLKRNISPTNQSFDWYAFIKASSAARAFGSTLSLDGDQLVVGGVDRVEVFQASNLVWSKDTQLVSSNYESEDQFGASVAISSNTVVVGAPYEDSRALGVNGDGNDNSALNSGAAYVFYRLGSSWVQQAYLKASNTQQGDHFGSAVSISGDLVLVGARGEDSGAAGVNGDSNDNSSLNSGSAYVFTRDGTSWTQQAYLKPSNTGSSDYFGSVAAISGDSMLVGADFEDGSSVVLR
jgi:hypothetical protein